jgi:uncharacterized membrane-anchored protein
MNINKDLSKGKEIILAALSRLDSGKIIFLPSDKQSSKQKNKIQSIVDQITDKAAGAANIMEFGEDEIIRSLHSYTRGSVHYAISSNQSFTDSDVINDLSDYIAQEAYLNCARKVLNTNRLDSWICDAKIQIA